jgi:site-specific DNA-methyltransferase (adenine-specific)
VNTESNNAPVPAYPLNQLHQVDALHLVSNLPDDSLDMLLTDPPYSSGGLHVGARTKTTSKKYLVSTSQSLYQDFISDNMDQRSWQFWCHAWLSQARRALKPGGIVVCCIDWRQLPALTDVVQAAGFTLQYGIKRLAAIGRGVAVSPSKRSSSCGPARARCPSVRCICLVCSRPVWRCQSST